MQTSRRVQSERQKIGERVNPHLTKFLLHSENMLYLLGSNARHVVQNRASCYLTGLRAITRAIAFALSG